jgi:hypothetical protein
MLPGAEPKGITTLTSSPTGVTGVATTGLAWLKLGLCWGTAA